ncbi:hypothetical protein [Cupriavidus oxalaticus]|uniref:Uncharacterized protein n=1 Tax=Cupriavidus oxalaticus TaxID=96344 RepID=A0A375FUU9_9BURK|nr:hypothetical protein [Cupriavidus oxalaticus]WQD84303.1 hypothetical protein U0036_07310 [Cupriavidus oxalaticus]SPC05526.1 conserved hypothetical protein [Cupriavidus oxalaticus]SPC10555.1 conserved hypothetical protein [Cupriavidus oxalaticus]SPC12194.1 conserved hypothetical protein [Cupriavidus oxalaticus]
MTPRFLNPSRSDDESRHGVVLCGSMRFCGYGNAREIAFLVADRVPMHFDAAPGSGETGLPAPLTGIAMSS